MFAVVFGAYFPKKKDPDLISNCVEETRFLLLRPLKHKHRSGPREHGALCDGGRATTIRARLTADVFYVTLVIVWACRDVVCVCVCVVFHTWRPSATRFFTFQLESAASSLLMCVITVTVKGDRKVSHSCKPRARM